MILEVLFIILFLFFTLGIPIIRFYNANIRPSIKENKLEKHKEILESAPLEVQTKVKEINTALSQKKKLKATDLDELGINILLQGCDENKNIVFYFFKIEDQIYAGCNTQFQNYNTALYSGMPAFGIREIVDEKLVYHPSDIRFTSVTVGSVTTGGYSDYGNFYTTEYENSGKYYIYCKMKDYRFPFLRMKLNSNLEKDRKSNEFLSKLKHDPEGYIVLLHDIKYDYQLEIEMAARMQDAALLKHYEEKRINDALFNHQECKCVCDWIIANAFSDKAYK